MQKHIKYILIFMLVLVGFISCEEDYGLKDTQNQSSLDLNTVSSSDVAKAFKESSSLTKSGQSWITPYFQYNDSISINNSNAKITVTPVITSVTNAYSRLFSLEINGTVESVLYHMIPNDQSSPASFWGKVIITDLSGELMSAFDIENNLYTGYYDLAHHPETINILDTSKNNFNKNSGGDENNDDSGNVGDPCDDCGWEDELEGVTVTAPPNNGLSMGIIIIFVPQFTNGQDQGGGGIILPSSPSEPTAGGSNTNQDSCPPGKIKDDNGNCVDPPVEVECDEENGYYPNEDGKCVKDPCTEINSLLTNQKYKDKLDELKGQTDFVTEKGYGYHTSDNFNLMGLANDGRSVSVKHFNLNFYTGFVHTHTCDTQNPNETNISMPSPADIKAIKTLIGTANINGRNIHDVFVTVVNCHGIFDLRYTGTFANINNHNYSDSSNDTFESYFEDTENPVLAFKKYLKEVVKLDGLELYEYIEDDTTEDYDVNHISFNQNGDDLKTQNDCN